MTAASFGATSPEAQTRPGSRCSGARRSSSRRRIRRRPPVRRPNVTVDLRQGTHYTLDISQRQPWTLRNPSTREPRPREHHADEGDRARTSQRRRAVSGVDRARLHVEARRAADAAGAGNQDGAQGDVQRRGARRDLAHVGDRCVESPRSRGFSCPVMRQHHEISRKPRRRERHALELFLSEFVFAVSTTAP